MNEASFGGQGAESTSVSASSLIRWLSLYLGYHEWYEQLRMCDLVIDGKGRTIRGSSAGSGDGDLSKRSAFAMGMTENQVSLALGGKVGGGSVLGEGDIYKVITCICSSLTRFTQTPPTILAPPISRYDSAKPARVSLRTKALTSGISTS